MSPGPDDLTAMSVEQLIERLGKYTGHRSDMPGGQLWSVIAERLRRLEQESAELRLEVEAFRALAAWSATRDEPLPEWIAGTVDCLICGEAWVAVCEDGTTLLECPSCGHMNAPEES